MNGKVSPAMAGGLVVVLLLIISFIGYRMFLYKESSGKPPPEAQKWLHPGSNGMAEHGATQPGAGGPPPGQGGAAMQNYYQQQQQGH